MAKLFDISTDSEAWIATRPAAVRELIAKCPPNLLYRMKSTGQRVVLHGYQERGTLIVDITGKYNLIDFDRRVFGIDPDDLEECDFPPSDEPIGTMLTDKDDVKAFIDKIPVDPRGAQAGRREGTL